jgi:p-cumate 2,3-dioxygenase beta subunit
MAAGQAPSLREEVELFLYEEALLLDAWRLEEWLKLFADDGTYLIPNLDMPDASPGESLHLIADDRPRLFSRVNQLQGRQAWSENPHSRTRHLVTNVLARADGDVGIRVTANFAVYRFRHENVDNYVGRYEHKLRRVPEGLRFVERKAILDLETLRPQGKVSIII